MIQSQSSDPVPPSTPSTPSLLPRLVLFKDPDPSYTSLLSPFTSHLEYVPLLRPNELPLIPPPLDLLANPGPMAWIFTSKHAATYFIPYLSQCTAPSTFFAISEATAKPLINAGFHVLGTHAHTAHQLAHFILTWSQSHPNTQYVFVTGKQHREELPTLLTPSLPLSLLTVYSMEAQKIHHPIDINALWVFFSPRGTHIVHQQCPVWSNQLIAIGPSTAQALRSLGKTADVTTEPSATGILEILRWKQDKERKERNEVSQMEVHTTIQ
ncbi:hypothetical protein HMI54_003279 [Coelomomyces lativittatus]|nr:hypothetical protein HMI55_004312 [Coelomomyces lativittatus]KAJ1514661.1 hypothetical protein HMI56_007696 [Coelomomyces lativittatus]KAJ1517942.1 hypothetical protein HMI54_003279 [Coelomomyces lativittatus]